MAKHGEGLGYEIVKAVNNGEITEPITFEKVKEFCKNNGLTPSENHMRVILSNSTENNHSPTYKKYFEHVGTGEYTLHSDYRKKYFWLNVDYDYYEWSFSSMKVGESETYSNMNKDGGKRKNEGCFNSIKIGDHVLAYETRETKAITAICEVVDKYEKNNKLIVEFEKKKGFKKFLTLDKMREVESLNDCKVIEFHRGTLFELEKKHFNEIVRILEELNTRTDYFAELDKEVQKSRKLSSYERKKRLENRKNIIPEKLERTSIEFKRNPDVIAEVLERAKGICEECGNLAPFNRASDGTPYLEVHHKIWLAEGGEDTVDNAIAVCPNCHRELHFG